MSVGRGERTASKGFQLRCQTPPKFQNVGASLPEEENVDIDGSEAEEQEEVLEGPRVMLVVLLCPLPESVGQIDPVEVVEVEVMENG